MKIRLVRGDQNPPPFDVDGVKYQLWAQPKRSKITEFERVAERPEGTFLQGVVSVMKLRSGGNQIEEETILSEPFDDHTYKGLAYTKAVTEGFVVKPGAEETAKLLVTHGLAEEVVSLHDSHLICT